MLAIEPLLEKKNVGGLSQDGFKNWCIQACSVRRNLNSVICKNGQGLQSSNIVSELFSTISASKSSRD